MKNPSSNGGERVDVSSAGLAISRATSDLRRCMCTYKYSAAPVHARTRAHRPAAPRQSSGVSQRKS